MPDELKPSQLRDAVNISMSYASMILSGSRVPPLPLAISIYRKLGRKLGPIANASDEYIDEAERLQGEAA